MMKQIKVAVLCDELETKLLELHYSGDSMHRCRKVFREFTEYADDRDCPQSEGASFLVWKFRQLGGFAASGEHSKNEMHCFRAIRSLAEYYNFGILFRRHDFNGEIVWPEPFKEAAECFLRYEVECGRPHFQYERCKAVIKDLMLFLDSCGVHDLNGITSGLISRFIETMAGLAPAAIAERASALRQYFKHAYLNEFAGKPIAACLPRPPRRVRAKLPTVWTEDQIESLINAVGATAPIGKRDYAIILIGARLGFRIGDILNSAANDIDWDNKLISTVQGKTLETQTMPPPSDAGRAIIGCLKNGRPAADCPNIFAAHSAPYAGRPFKSTLRSNLGKALKRAGMPIDKSRRYGWRSLRHSLAANLLQNNVEASTISDILGHSDPQVASHYLRVDMKGLSKCALEVEAMGYVKE
jgi:integrase